MIEILKLLKNREQGSLFNEIKKEDRILLDSIFFKQLNLSKQDLNELYQEEINYINERNIKSKSVKNVKAKHIT